MNAAEIWDYDAQPREKPTGCNLCGNQFPNTWMEHDRYGYSVMVARCDLCDLVSLSRRMTKEAYARFYSTGAYRRLVSAYHGREITEETIKPEQEEYAEKLLAWLREWKAPCRNILDVGGATGVVADVIAKGLGSERITIVDPSKNGPVEDWNPGSRHWDLILMCQTADHLLDLSGTLRKLKDCLTNRGQFFVDILDYAQSREIKIDHPFNLTKETMTAFLEKAGFRIDGVRLDNRHIGFLCQ